MEKFYNLGVRPSHVRSNLSRYLKQKDFAIKKLKPSMETHGN